MGSVELFTSQASYAGLDVVECGAQFVTAQPGRLLVVGSDGQGLLGARDAVLAVAAAIIGDGGDLG